MDKRPQRKSIKIHTDIKQLIEDISYYNRISNMDILREAMITLAKTKYPKSYERWKNNETPKI